MKGGDPRCGRRGGKLISGIGIGRRRNLRMKRGLGGGGSFFFSAYSSVWGGRVRPLTGKCDRLKTEANEL